MTKMLLSTVAFAAAIALPAMAFAETANQTMFQYGGEQYVYSVKTDGNVRYIVGEQTSTHSPFTLKVSDNRVTGNVDGRPVSFLTASVKPRK